MKCKNPVIYVDYSDPDVVRVGKDYVMTASSFTNTPGLPILHSEDLVHWKLVNYALPNIPDVSYNKPRHGCGVWAPAIRYHEGLYYIYYPMPDEGIFVTTASDFRGEWSEPVCVIKASGFIDPCPYWDEDGRVYLVYGVAKSRIGYKSVLYMQELSSDGMSVIGERVKVFDGNENGNDTIEGPKLYKKDDYYYILAPAGGVKPGWQLALRSKSIWGPYEYKRVLESKDSGINGPHQGALVDTVSGEDWFIHFRDVYAAGRIVYLEPVKWVDGWPVMGAEGAPVSEYEAPDTSVSNFTESLPMSDDFSDGLSLQWQWNANHRAEFYEISDGKLKLPCLKKTADVLFDEPNILLQKWNGNRFKAEFMLDISNLKVSDTVGIIHASMKYASLAVRVTDSGVELLEIKGVQSFKNSIAYTDENVTVLGHYELPEDGLITMVYEAAEGDRHEVVEGVDYALEKVHLKAFDHDVSIDAYPGRWVGAKFGMYALSTGTDGGYLLCDKVSVEKG